MTEEVLLVPAYRRPGAMNTWWYAAVGSDDDQGRCSMGQALLPGISHGVTEWDPKYVWEIHHVYPGYVAFKNKKTRQGLYFVGPNKPLAGPGGATDEMWSLGGPIDKYDTPGFAIRPYHDVDQNVNAFDGWQHGHNGMVGATVGTWGWCHAQENEVWAILRVDPDNGHARQTFAHKLDAQGWPDYGQ